MIFYRVANINTNQGLWYNINGEFTGLIHNKFKFCTNTNLPMIFDPNVEGYLSATKSLNELFHWFTKEDIIKLEEYDYFIMKYSSSDYKYYNNHWLINKNTSLLIDRIKIKQYENLCV